MYTLLIDSGNTYTKLVTLQGDRILHRLRISGNVQEAVEQIQNLTARTEAFNPALWNLLYSSVSSTRSKLEAYLKRRASYVLILGTDTPLPLKEIRYNRKTLGVDRLAVAVAAFEKSALRMRDALIIDIGSAITFDRITRDGVFLGGTISPGPGLRLQALHTFTARLPLVELPMHTNPALLTPQSTTDAITQGVKLGILFEVQEYIRKTLADNSETDVYLTGGWAPYFADQLKNVTFVFPDLQMQGLNSILAYNLQ